MRNKSDLIKINTEQGLYVLKVGEKGFSCLGFENAERDRVAILKWLHLPVDEITLGTEEHYAAYREAMAKGQAHYAATGQRCTANLTPALSRYEGQRVEVAYGDYKQRFWVGKSTGWMPIHLEVLTRRSFGGGAAYVPEGATVRLIKARA